MARNDNAWGDLATMAGKRTIPNDDTRAHRSVRESRLMMREYNIRFKSSGGV